MTTWMVVEDEPDLYDMVLTMYEMMGIDGKAFTSGEDAIAWIEDVGNGQLDSELPQLALLDIRLPEIDGPTVAMHLRSNPVLQDIVIVFMTAYKLTPRQENEIMEKTQADLFLYKPLPPLPELQRILQDLGR